MKGINGLEDLRIEGPFEFCELDYLWIYGRVNEHGCLRISGIIKQEDILKDQPQGKNITIWGEDRERPWFSGIIDTFSLTEKGGLRHISVHCSSYTSLLDRTLSSRAFQNSALRYRDLLEAAGKHFEQKNRLLVTAKEARQKIGAPVIQYQETDWEFLKRMAGRLHTFVIPEITYPMTQLSIGCIRGERHIVEEDEVEEYEEILDLDRLRRDGNRQSKLFYLSHRIRISENYELGDRIQWKDQEFRIIEKNLILERGAIAGEYLLGFEPGFCLEEQYNRNIRGISLSGSVIGRKEGMLKVHLDIDAKQEPEQAYWYPYTPMTGNIMYSVPELGTRVLLNIASEREEDAKVSCCVRAESTVALPVETKTMWTDGSNYTATPDYMGFDCENAGSLADAFVLDDEVGLVAYGKNEYRYGRKELSHWGAVGISH